MCYTKAKKISKRANDQKLIENFFVLSQAKTEIKVNKTQISLNKQISKEEENINENKNIYNITKPKD